jgi:hypothetical protein
LLNHGFPGFYYSSNRPFSKTDKEKFLIVEEGVLLKSIEDDMELENLIKLKDEIFGNVMLHEI